jgi:hypothetical protein
LKPSRQLFKDSRECNSRRIIRNARLLRRDILWRTISHQEEYNQETYAWYYWEAECDDWYMDSCHFWDDNHFHLLFDDSTPPYVEHINGEIDKSLLCIFFWYFLPYFFEYFG